MKSNIFYILCKLHFNRSKTILRMGSEMVEAPDHCPGTGTEQSGKADACQVYLFLCLDTLSLKCF